MRSTPPPLDDSNVVIGQILGARGYAGFVRARILTALTNRFDEGNYVQIGQRKYWISEVEYIASSHVLLRFLGINTVEDAQSLQGEWLTIPTDDNQDLGPDNYFHYQMIGLSVETEDGEVLGVGRGLELNGRVQREVAAAGEALRCRGGRRDQRDP